MSPIIQTLSWSETRTIFEDHVRSGIKNAPILALIEWLENQKLTSELFSTAMHADMVLGATPTFPAWEHMLSIRWNNAGEVFTFIYFKKGSHPEMEKVVKEEEGIETLRLMLAYKFGLHRKPIAEPTASPNGGLPSSVGSSEPSEGRHR